MVFTWLNKQGVRSDRGFEVQFTSRFDAEYREGGRVVSLYVEAGVSGGLQCIIVDPSAFERWDGDPPSVTIPAAEQARLFQNLREAMEFQGLKLAVEKGESPTGYEAR
jgi:hypothetical protein